MIRPLTNSASAEFNEVSGISILDAWRKSLLTEREAHKSLVLFLQGLSVKSGGLKAVARDVIALFPERVGTDALRALKLSQEDICPDESLKQIVGELARDRYHVNGAQVDIYWVLERTGIEGFYSLVKQVDDIDSDIEADIPGQDSQRQHKPNIQYTVGQIYGVCRQLAEWDLPWVIWNICTNPYWMLSDRSENKVTTGYRVDSIYTRRFQTNHPEARNQYFLYPDAPYFQDVLYTLFEYQAKYEARARESIVETGIARQVFETLDKAFTAKTATRMVLIEGRSRIGKTTALTAWAESHLDKARMISLSSAANRHSFIKQIAAALGIFHRPHTGLYRIQTDIETFLRSSGIMLLFDEGQFLWPQTAKITGRPELIDFVDTALCNSGLPVAIAATQQFIHRKQQVESQTGWTGEQFVGRLLAYKKLPEVPSREDIESVAKRMVPGLDSASSKYLVGYCMTVPTPLHVLSLIAADILAECGKTGQKPGFECVKSAIEARKPGDSALARFAQPTPAAARRRPAPALSAPVAASADSEADDYSQVDDLQAARIRPATALQSSCMARENDLEATAAELATAPDRRQVPSMDNSRAQRPLSGPRRGLAPKEAPSAQRQAEPAAA